jgi:response regulator RpfG family c-di-GMP phosphodiesterase
MNKAPLRHLIIRRILVAFLVFLVAIIAVILFHFREFTIANIEEKSEAVGELVLAGLTAHMRSGTMDDRSYFLSEITQMGGVSDIWIVRSNALNEQFGHPNGDQFERTGDALDLEAFKAGTSRFEIDEFGRGVMRVAIPYIARSDGALNCLQCHQVPEGTVLGVLNVESSITDARKSALIYGVLVGLMVLLFVAIMVAGSMRLTDRFVLSPLKKMTYLFEKSIRGKKPIDEALFRTDDFSNAVTKFNRVIKEVNDKADELENLNTEIEATLKETIFTLAAVGERKCEETGNHVRRVQHCSALLAELAGLSEEEINLIKIASPLHDIGKVGIPERIIQKPGKLNDAEYQVVRTHATLGYEMLRHSSRDVMQAAATIAYEHHEHYDGHGYPRGIEGEAIHIFGRITAIADVFDALANDRYYKPAWPHDEIKRLFKEQRGRQFDPQLIDLFLGHYDAFVEILNRYCDDKEDN